MKNFVNWSLCVAFIWGVGVGMLILQIRTPSSHIQKAFTDDVVCADVEYRDMPWGTFIRPGDAQPCQSSASVGNRLGQLTDQQSADYIKTHPDRGVIHNNPPQDSYYYAPTFSPTSIFETGPIHCTDSNLCRLSTPPQSPKVGQIQVFTSDGYLTWMDGPKSLKPCFYYDGRPPDRACVPKAKR